MAWNSSDKAIRATDKKSISMGAPVAYNAGLVGKAYTDGWDIERAYREGLGQRRGRDQAGNEGPRNRFEAGHGFKLRAGA